MFYGKIEIFDFKKTPFRYVFSIAIMYSCETVWVKVLLSKGWMVAVRNYSTNTIMEKNKQGEGGGLRIQNLVLIPLGHFELHFWLCQPQTRKTTVV